MKDKIKPKLKGPKHKLGKGLAAEVSRQAAEMGLSREQWLDRAIAFALENMRKKC